jgi:eukaryotic-like serine/threonine-protein kinase
MVQPVATMVRRDAREYFERVVDADKQGNYAERVRVLTNPAS